MSKAPIIAKVFFAAEEAVVEPWQRALTKGDRFIYRSTTTDQLMWAEVIEEPDPKIGAYRFVRAFCEGNPKGEEGVVHVACAFGKVGDLAWRIARDDGWPDDHNIESYARYVVKLNHAMKFAASAN